MKIARFLVPLFVVLVLCNAIWGATPPTRVGTITIDGNTKTSDYIIRSLLPFVPGQILEKKAVQEAEMKLAASGLFKKNPKKGIRPTVKILKNIQDPDSEFVDIVVLVTEREPGLGRLCCQLYWELQIFWWELQSLPSNLLP